MLVLFWRKGKGQTSFFCQGIVYSPRPSLWPRPCSWVPSGLDQLISPLPGWCRQWPDTGLWLVQPDHVTPVLSSHWSRLEDADSDWRPDTSLHCPVFTVSSLKVGSWDEALDAAWGGLWSPDLGCTSDTSSIRFPLPDPASSCGLVQQCTVHELTRSSSISSDKKIKQSPFELFVERIKIVGILGESVSLFLEVSSLLSHWAVGMRQKDKIILGLPSFVSLQFVQSPGTVNIPPMIQHILVKSSQTAQNCHTILFLTTTFSLSLLSC